MGSPLGRYSETAATVAAVTVIVAWVGIHLLIAVLQAFGTGVPGNVETSQIDLAGTLALGIVLGQRATTNGASHIANSANARLDAIGAPSAAAATASLAAGIPPMTPVNPPAPWRDPIPNMGRQPDPPAGPAGPPP